jgi:carbon storage regulator
MTMLVLTRKPGEKVRIGDDITLEVLQVSGNRVRIAFAAPARVPIRRDELCPSLAAPLTSRDRIRQETDHAAANR